MQRGVWKGGVRRGHEVAQRGACTGAWRVQMGRGEAWREWKGMKDGRGGGW